VDDYEIVRQLGQGGFGQVFLLKDRQSGLERCGKLIRRDSMSAFESEDIMAEILTLSEIDHPNIVKILCYYITEEHLFIVAEYLNGGELFDRIVKRKHFSEVDAAPLMAQLLSAIAYLHKYQIVHRDIKPENIVFESPEETAVLKLIDFGNSRKVTENQKLKSKLGTLFYLAPEILDASYDTKCDIWSAGCVLFVLLFGVPPFTGKTDIEVLTNIKRGIIHYPERNYRISNEARALISLMLNRNASQRPSAEMLLRHVWFDRVRERKIAPEVQGMALVHLQKFVTQNEFQKAILVYFITQFDIQKQKNKLLDVFKALDDDMDGQIDRHELLALYRKFTKDPRIELVIQHIMDELDLNDSQTINYSEFLLATTNYRQLLTETHLAHIFSVIDVDRSKFITCRELAQFLNLMGPEHLEEVTRIFRDADINNDGHITYQEFVASMKQIFQS
jgi:calcium-dependent protein kinase